MVVVDSGKAKRHGVGEGQIEEKKGWQATDTREERRHWGLWFLVGCIWTLGPIYRCGHLRNLPL